MILLGCSISSNIMENKINRRRVFIVDDSIFVVKTLTGIFADLDVDVIGSASTCPTAISEIKANAENIDLITLDLNMPGGDGLAVLQELLAFKPDLKIVVVSSLGHNKDIVIKSIEAGALFFITKPFRADEIAEIMNKLCFTEDLIDDKATRNPNIFIIEDSDFMVKVLSQIFNNMGCKVLGTAGSALRGLKVLSEIHEPVDLITLDLHMPGRDGFAIIPDLVKNFPQARIVVVSSLINLEKIKNAISLGACFFIQKPIQEEKIITMMLKYFPHLAKNS